MSRRRHDRTRATRWPWFAVGLGLTLALLTAGSSTTSTGAAAAPEELAEGRQLYATACVTCHGEDAAGTDQGPSLLDEGPASVDFVLRTGRMPLPDPRLQPVRGAVEFDEQEIAALIAYLRTMGVDQPEIPHPDPEAGDVARGGEVFRANCATCHQAAAAGGVLTGGRTVPSLAVSSPRDVAEAMLIGPGAMPRFSGFDAATVDDVSAYVRYLQTSGDPGGAGIGRVGPFAEGLVAWAVGLAGLVLIARWIERGTSR